MYTAENESTKVSLKWGWGGENGSATGYYPTQNCDKPSIFIVYLGLLQWSAERRSLAHRRRILRVPEAAGRLTLSADLTRYVLGSL